MYKEYAWGKDDLVPRSRGGTNWLHMGNTIVDSLDTLLLSGLMREFEEGAGWVSNTLHFDAPVVVNAFEVTIRILGGLLSAHALTNRTVFLKKASDLAERLTVASASVERMPKNDVDLSRRVGRDQHSFSLAQVGTLQLEHNYLAHAAPSRLHIKHARYFCNVQKKLNAQLRVRKFLPTQVTSTGEPNSVVYSLGGEADSYFEYVLKSYLQGGGRDALLLKTYVTAMEFAFAKMLRRTHDRRAYLVSVWSNSHVALGGEMGHLECFAPGMIALGSTMLRRPAARRRHLRIAKALMLGCWQLYNRSATGVGMERAAFGGSSVLTTQPVDTRNMLRPEVAESIYYLYKTTGDEFYRDMGWKLFQSARAHSKGAFGYCSMDDVFRPSCDGKMESFWISETLKYLYLMFDDKIDLTAWVFNTEAHLLPVIDTEGSSC